MVDVLKAQLLALRSQVDAMLTVIEMATGAAKDLGLLTETAAGTCPHLETENIGTFGVPEYRCLACHQSVPTPG